MAILFLAIGVLSFLYTYVGWKLLVPLNLIQPWKTLTWIAVFTVAMLPLVSIAMRFNRMETVLNDLVSWLAYLSLGFVSILFFFLVLKDVFCFAGMMIGKLQWFSQPETSRVSEALSDGSWLSRRHLVLMSLNLAIVGFSGLLTGCGYVQARHRLKTIRVEIPLKNLPEEFEGYRIVQISDIHVGPTIKKEFVQEIADQVHALKADMVVLTGDLVDGSVDYLKDDVAPLANLNTPDGKFFVTGNHEYYSGVFPWLDQMNKFGFTVLLNEHAVITKKTSNLVLGGVTDLNAEQMIPEHKSDPGASLAGAPATETRILLAHQPVSVYEAAKAGYDLQLSGHTHGGQYFPFSKIVKIAQPFVAGLYKYQDTWLYVNRGTGYWGPPLRLGAPAEITEIILTGETEEGAA